MLRPNECFILDLSVKGRQYRKKFNIKSCKFNEWEIPFSSCINWCNFPRVKEENLDMYGHGFILYKGPFFIFFVF